MPVVSIAVLMLQHYMLASIGVPNIFVFRVPTNLTLMCVFLQSLSFLPFSDASIHVSSLFVRL